MKREELKRTTLAGKEEIQVNRRGRWVVRKEIWVHLKKEIWGKATRWATSNHRPLSQMQRMI